VRILYGTSNSGLSHTLRARVVAEELLGLGHEVRLAVAGRAARILRRRGFEVIDLGCDVKTALERATLFRPDVVVTDGSFFACLVARLTGVPLLPIDHEKRRARAGSYSRAIRGSS
jgi:UDP:flavonoid glycosyltransferase YjiC (YdhE family)